MSILTLKQIGPFAFEAQGDGWRVVIDQPVAKGGTGLGPTPAELLAISLAACKGITILKWAENKKLAVKDVGVEVRYEMTDNPRRMGEMDVVLHNVKSQVPAEMYERLEAALGGCIVSNTLKEPLKMGHRIK